MIFDRTRRYRLSQRFSAVALGFFLCFPQLVIGGDWDFTPRVTVTEEYSDNVTLSDQNTLSDFITTITPGLTVRGNSARLQTSVDYNMQNLRYIDNDNFDRTNHQMQSSAFLEVIKNIVDFQATAALSQQQTSNRGNFALSARSQTGDRTDVLNYQFRPIVKHHFGNWADVTGSYAYGSQLNTGGSVGNLGSGDDETFDLNINTGSKFAKTPITLRMTRNRSEFDSGRVNETESFTANFSFIYSRKLRLTAETGVDNNAFSGGGNGRDGFRWRVGGTLTPSPRTTLRGHFGERGFGQTFDVAVTHHHRRFNFALNYQEELRTNLQRQRQLQLIPLADANGAPVFNPFANSNILTPLDTPTINEEVSLSKSLNVNLNYQMRRSSINATYYQTDRTFQSSLTGEETRGYNLALTRNFWPRLTGTFSLSWREALRASGRNDSELFRFSPGLEYSLGPHTSLNLSYQYVDNKGGRGGGQVSNNFIENAVTANLAVFY